MIEISDVPKNPPTINSVKSLNLRGPWQTKSGGKLFVLSTLTFGELEQSFFNYDQNELVKIPEDIRGLRIYRVQGLTRGRIGGGEFHRIRQEIVICLEGEVRWTLKDLSGGEMVAWLLSNQGILVPPFILHSYEVLRWRASLLIVANTLFNPEDPRTHDTYSTEVFAELQARMCNRK